MPETVEVEKVMESMIRLDNCKVLFPTSFGFWPFIQKIAPKYPDVLFVHAGGLWKEGDAKNTIGYRGYMEEPHYLCGIAAGRMTSRTGKLGFIGSKPLYFIFNNCNGFIMGARSVRPGRQLPSRDYRRLGQPGERGGDGQQPGRPGRRRDRRQRRQPQGRGRNCGAARCHSCGYHTDLSALAPNGFLTGAEWNWAKGGDFVKAWQTGGAYPNLYRGGFSRDMVAISPFGKVVPEPVRAEIGKAQQGFADDSLKLYKGP